MVLLAHEDNLASEWLTLAYGNCNGKARGNWRNPLRLPHLRRSLSVSLVRNPKLAVFWPALSAEPCANVQLFQVASSFSGSFRLVRSYQLLPLQNCEPNLRDELPN